jgi:uncharacterized protein YjiS (DUF1127 family)
MLCRCYWLREKLISQSSNDDGAKTWLLTSDKPQERGNIMNVARSFNNWRKYRQTVSELGRMTTRELRDLGIDRSDIQSVARAAVAR